jgi:hypothetical protein
MVAAKRGRCYSTIAVNLSTGTRRNWRKFCGKSKAVSASWQTCRGDSFRLFFGTNAALISTAFRGIVKRFLLKICRPFFVVGLRNATFTCLGKTDGGGAQVHAIASVAAFAEYVGAQFVHSPLRHVEHCPPNLSMADFCQQWESVVSLFAFPSATGEKFTSYQVPTETLKFFKDVAMLKTRGRLICLPHAHFLTDYIPGIYELLRPYSRPPLKPSNQCLQIAVHVRRGDVGPCGRNSERYSPDEVIRHQIETVREQCGAKSQVTIVTEDPEPGFIRMFADCTVVTHENPLEALALLIDADVLVMAKSSFSFVAGLLSKGRVYYSDFWSSPQPSWSVVPVAS